MEKKFYTAKEAAERVTISVKMIYKLIENRQIPYTKIGSKILIPIEPFNEWITKNTYQAVN